MLRKTDNACLQFVMLQVLDLAIEQLSRFCRAQQVRPALVARNGQMHCTHLTVFGKPFNTALPVRVIGQSGNQIKDCISRLCSIV
jgi:hypothetical protein